jgi:hypothetical protein
MADLIMPERMAAGLGFKHQSETRVAVNIDGGHWVHLDRHFQAGHLILGWFSMMGLSGWRLVLQSGGPAETNPERKENFSKRYFFVGEAVVAVP